MWIMAAPAASQALALETSSSRVTGSAGTSALLDSAPVGATVIKVWLLPPCRRSCHAGRSRGAACPTWTSPSRSTNRPDLPKET